MLENRAPQPEGDLPLPSDRLSRQPDSLKPIDISDYREGNTGIEYVTTFDSGRPGPHAMICALVHGNEFCGAHAHAFLIANGVRPERGKLTLCFANVAAYRSFDWRDPTASRYLDEDFNRLWSDTVLDRPRRSREAERARALRSLVQEADYLLDLHSMLMPGEALILSGLTEKGRALARAVGFPACIVADAGHAGGPRLRDYGAFADPSAPQTALLVECGQHWQPESADVAVEVSLRFLAHLRLIDAALCDRYLGPVPRGPQRCIEVSEAVTIESEEFRFLREIRSLDVIAAAGTPIADDGGAMIRTPYDDCALVMPSGNLARGQTAVRFGRFVA